MSDSSNAGILATVYFASFSLDIDSSSNASLLVLSDSLKKDESLKIEIRGFADSTGGAAANLRLSRFRAENVKRILMGLGIAGERMTVKPFGEDPKYAKGDNSTDEGRRLNRRVEVHRVKE